MHYTIIELNFGWLLRFGINGQEQQYICERYIDCLRILQTLQFELTSEDRKKTA